MTKKMEGSTYGQGTYRKVSPNGKVYYHNKEYQKDWAAKNRKEKTARAYEYLGNKCIICGYDTESDGLVIDHIIPVLRKGQREFEFQSPGTWMNKAWSRIEVELEKCQLLCGTCHLIKSRREQRDRYTDNG